MTKEEAMKLQPFDVVVYVNKLPGLDTKRFDVLVKKVTENGVFCIEGIRPTAVLYKYKDLEQKQ